ncbi:Molybdate-binding protein ModA [bioreactor metagenome]|uniref:Molybdate-binding protein ModA n=1 Tax=bioreactor metagenome TaxID=1076179 RepID=A0A644V491_9ZZZZ|nr:molybdate ABC transporter substrate-binding protein [Lachnospiraceae bacterium]MEA5092103.1 molybdate ABC transporter substrate-binding protein [Acidaminococcaceae bacterium]
MRKSLQAILSGLLVMGIIASGCSSEKKENTKGTTPVELHISAAASMTDAMKEIAKDYEKKNANIKVVFNFASSGALQQAIEQGAPADVFISAAQKQMDSLEKSGLLATGTRKNLLENKVVLIIPKDSKLKLTKFEDVLNADVKKIGLGEPKGVPVGQYSAEIFKKLGILDEVNAKAVFGSSVRQVLSWVDAGEVDAGVVYATDAAISNGNKVICTAPAGSHKPVVYPMAIIKSTKQLAPAQAFVDYLASAEGKKIFEKYGFTVK